MKTSTIIATAALSILAAASVQAETYHGVHAAVSAVSRSEIRADLDMARAAGALTSGEKSYVAPTVGQAASRSDVRAELAAARANHELSSGELTFVAEAHAQRQRPASAQTVGPAVR